MYINIFVSLYLVNALLLYIIRCEPRNLNFLSTHHSFLLFLDNKKKGISNVNIVLNSENVKPTYSTLRLQDVSLKLYLINIDTYNTELIYIYRYKNNHIA